MHLSLSKLQVFSRSRLSLTGVGTKLEVSPHLFLMPFMLLAPVSQRWHVIFMMMAEVQKSKSFCISTLQASADISLGKSSPMTTPSIIGTGYHAPPTEVQGKSECLPNNHIIV